MIISEKILDLLHSVKSKRAKTVIELLLKNGRVTTEELEKLGYQHPPRAVRDVRENGIPIKTVRIKGENGKMIAAYEFDDFDKIENFKLGGRKLFTKEFKKKLVEKLGSKCGICNELYESIYLQIDHRIPYQVAGESIDTANIDGFMLLCPSCNRKKSWSCEHCLNWQIKKDPATCMSCFWANPSSYNHMAMQRVRTLELVWNESEIEKYEKIKEKAENSRLNLVDYVKEILNKLG